MSNKTIRELGEEGQQVLFIVDDNIVLRSEGWSNPFDNPSDPNEVAAINIVNFTGLYNILQGTFFLQTNWENFKDESDIPHFTNWIKQYNRSVK